MALTIPSIFTAVDRVSAPFRAMSGKVAAGAARMERSFQAINQATDQIADKSLVGGLAIAGTMAYAVKKAMEYEDELANLKALTGASGKDFEQFKGSIEATATSMKRTKIETAQAFSVIGNNMPDLLTDAKGMETVTRATLTLSRAGRMETEETAISLTNMMNQYKKGADFAFQAIDIIAAGGKAGSSEINQTSDAIQKFGTVAAGFNVSFAESNALVQLGSKFEKGADAGVKFRNILAKMATAKVLPKDALNDLARAKVNLNVVTNASLPFQVRLKEMAKIAKSSTAVVHVFGEENLAMATGILNSADSFKSLLDQINASGEAERMAAENSNTLKVRMAIAKANMDNLAITIGTKLIPSLTRLFEKIAPIIERATAWAERNPELTKTLIKMTVAIGGVMLALWTLSTIAGGITAAIQAFNFVMIIARGIQWTLTAAQLALNAAMIANPIGLLIAAFVVLVGYVALAVAKWNQFGAVMIILLGPFGLLISIIQSLRRNWDMLTKAFKEGGLKGLFIGLGKVFVDALLMPLQQLLLLASKIPGSIGSAAAEGAAKIQAMRNDIGVNVTTDESGAPLVSTKVTSQEVNTNTTLTEQSSQRLLIDFSNMPAWVKTSTNTNGQGSAAPTVTSTRVS